jgi:activating signal cointegrator 1
MKALTLCQPYATLVVLGLKRIETRSWYMSHRGELLIHAAAGVGYLGSMSALRDLCCREPFFSALKAGGIDLDVVDVDALPFGALIGQCQVVDCREIVENRTQLENWMRPAMLPPDEPERSFGDYRAGRFATLLADARAFPTPIPARGAQRLWHWEGTL